MTGVSAGERPRDRIRDITTAPGRHEIRTEGVLQCADKQPAASPVLCRLRDRRIRRPQTHKKALSL